MKRLKWRLFLFFSAILSITSCIKQEHYPDVPQIQPVNFISVFDTGKYAIKGIMSISFTDGNGDIGLLEGDTLSPFDTAGPYYYNFVIVFFNKQQGVYHQIDLKPPFSARIPMLNTQYPGKSIKGTITDTLNLGLIPHPGYDTIRFETYIYDRALNKSNVITTPDIVLKKPF